MLPFYKEGVRRLATSNGIWQRPLVDEEFKPIAQPVILNVGSGDNTQTDYPRTIKLDSYSIVNQENAVWQWNVVPEPVAINSKNIRNPIMTIAPDQTYDITLTVTTPGGSDTKTIEGMIKGRKAVSESTTALKISAEKDLQLVGGNVVAVGGGFLFVPRNIEKNIILTIYNSKGEVVYSIETSGAVNVDTSGFSSGVYFYMAESTDGFKKTGKLLVK